MCSVESHFYVTWLFDDYASVVFGHEVLFTLPLHRPLHLVFTGQTHTNVQNVANRQAFWIPKNIGSEVHQFDVFLLYDIGDDSPVVVLS